MCYLIAILWLLAIASIVGCDAWDRFFSNVWGERLFWLNVVFAITVSVWALLAHWPNRPVAWTADALGLVTIGLFGGGIVSKICDRQRRLIGFISTTPLDEEPEGAQT